MPNIDTTFSKDIDAERRKEDMDKYIVVDGLNTRYVDEGTGEVLLLLHGASLGSSLEVYEKNLPVFVKAGFRTIAFDSPGFGLTDNPRDYSDSYRTDFVLKFMDALGIARAHLVAHSATGRMAAKIASAHPQRLGKVIPVAATPLVPPLPNQKERGETEATPPSPESARKRLEGDLFNHSLITDEMIQKRYRLSTGKNFDAALARDKALRASKGTKEEPPLWEQFARSSISKLYLFGKDDRGGTVAKRCALLAEMEPSLKFHLIERCNHLMMIDAEEGFNKRVVEFVTHG